MESNNKNGSKIVIVILAILVVLLGGYIGYDKFLKKDVTKEVTKCADDPVKIETKDVINNGERLGTYSFYMGSNSDGEYALTFFTPNNTTNKNEGFFSLVQSTSMSYNEVAKGYFEIKDSYIEFYTNMLNDNDKANFAEAFSMEVSDLYQDSKAVSEGYSIQYRLKLNYEFDKISNGKLSLKKIY